MYLPTMENLNLSVTPDASRLLADISRLLAEEDIPSYLVGGFVRDTLLGRDTADIDIAVADDALKIVPKIAAALGGRYIPLDEKNGVAKVILLSNGNAPAKTKWELDFATLKGNIEQDLAQRDFTIDAIAIDFEKITASSRSAQVIPGLEILIDPFNGQDDLHRRLVRAVSDITFKMDAVRLMRAVRLSAELGFYIDSDTEKLIYHDHHLIAGVAGERIREELLRILAMPRAGQRLAYLEKLGLLTALIPELALAKGVSQPKVHVWDVFEHSIQTVSAVEFLLREGAWEHAGKEILTPVPWSDGLSRHFAQEVSSGSTRKSMLKLAALLHDVAKPQTKTVDEDGRARFLGHPQEGADIAGGVLERLRLSTRETKLVDIMVRHHLRPGQMSHEELPSRRAIYRYFRDTEEAGIDILFLSLADHLATRGADLDPAEWQAHNRIVEYLLTKHSEEESLSAPPKLIDGNDLIKDFGMSPGPGVGELLEAVREAQAAGEVNTREQALDCVKNLLTKKG